MYCGMQTKKMNCFKKLNMVANTKPLHCDRSALRLQKQLSVLIRRRGKDQGLMKAPLPPP